MMDSAYDILIGTLSLILWNFDTIWRPFWQFSLKLTCLLVSFHLNRICTSLYTQGVLRVRKRVTLMGVTVTAIFGICWAPDIFSHNLDYYTSLRISELAYAVIHMLVLFSSAINPFVYALVNKTFREKLKRMMHFRCIDSTRSTRIRDFSPKETCTASLEWPKYLKHYYLLFIKIQLSVINVTALLKLSLVRYS